MLLADRLIAAPAAAKSGMQNIDSVDDARTVCTS